MTTRRPTGLVAGTPAGWSWDGDARVIEVAWDTAPVDGPLGADALTEVWVPARHHPEDYQVVDLAGAEVVSATSAQQLLERNVVGATSASLRIVPGTSSPTGVAPPEPAPTSDVVAPTLPATGGGLAVAGLATLLFRRRRR